MHRIVSKRLIGVALGASLVALVHQSHAQAAPGVREFNAGPLPQTVGWSATATKSLAPLLTKATDRGQIAGTTPLRIVVGLKMRNLAGAKMLLQLEHTPFNALYQTKTTPARFTAAYNPTGAQVAAVGQYLVSRGFTNVVAEPNNLMVTGNATAAQVEAAFRTRIDNFRQPNGQQIYAQVEAALVPASLGGTVLAVLGLNDIQMHTAIVPRRAPLRFIRGTAPINAATPNPSPPPGASPPPDACLTPPDPVYNACTRGYTATDFRTVYGGTKINNNHQYDGTTSTTGFRDNMAVFAEGDLSQVIKDLRTYEAVNHLPQVSYSVRPVGIFSPDTAGLDEWDLDSQSSTGIAYKVNHLTMYDTTSLTDSDTGLEFNKFVTDDTSNEGNASFGECEAFPYVDGAMVLDDEVFLQGASQGQTVFVSSGDNGNGCPVLVSTGIPASGPPEVSYPASSPYVVAVGGTSLLSNATTVQYVGEAGWIGSGGGPSQFEYEPYWERGVGFAAADAGNLRQVPDGSMDADPNVSPAIIYVNGAIFYVGGTSLASPLMMGTYARLMTAHYNEFGFAAPLMWEEYKIFPATTPPAVPTGPPGFMTAYVGGFHDQYDGANGAFTNLPRYDFVTGLGSSDIGMQTLYIDDICDGDTDQQKTCIKVSP
ncbi:MAG: S8/S53 family peptidase [Candidatus Eremiobacteraeota bacterium]|nr:S8/S53 family peptidase [Candidatus Eremiobacteraeota bacterium]